MRRLWRWWSSKERERKVARRACRPSLDALDKRDLPAITAISVSAVPNALIPPNNTYMKVQVSGTITQTILPPKLDTKTPITPTANFVIVDLYRQDEPSAPLTLTPTSTANQYSFSTSFFLHAHRAQHEKTGRFYYFTLEAGDQDGGVSRVIPILVPHGLTVPKPPPPVKHPYSFTNRAGALVVPNVHSSVNPFTSLFSFLSPKPPKK